jgi:hypothetical protein
MKIRLIGLIVILTLSALDGAFAQGTVEKAKGLYDTRKYDEAARLLNTVASKDPTYADSRYYLGRIALD